MCQLIYAIAAIRDICAAQEEDHARKETRLIRPWLGLLYICAAIGTTALGAPAIQAQETYRAWGQEPGQPFIPEPTHVPMPEPKTSWTSEDMQSALIGQPEMTRRIVYCECKYDPNVVVYRTDGSPLYYGCAQLMTGQGNGYDIFLRWGFTNWRDPEQVVGYINEVQARGMLASQYPNTRFGCAGSP